MIAIIIAGGSGTRLWPLSTPDYPKHLLNIGEDSTSLLQKTYERVSGVVSDIYVITEQSHAHHVREQLPEVSDSHCIVEPGRRGTANCALLALAKIAPNHDPKEPIIILWADHYIRDTDGFLQSIELAANASAEQNRLALIGVEPGYPATGFGYIKKAALLDKQGFVYEVDSFKEKPDHETAKKYLKDGHYLWNSGYLIGSLEVLLENMKKYSPELLEAYEALEQLDDAEKLKEYYLKLSLSNIDNALTEKVEDLLVVPATFDWMDLGSYPELHAASDLDEAGNHIEGAHVELDAVENSYIHSYDEKPVAVVGLDNIVVVNTKHGLLIARKDLSQSIGTISKRIYESKTE
jgi:mannose-1-phosphate guanylyltransferase